MSSRRLKRYYRDTEMESQFITHTTTYIETPGLTWGAWWWSWVATLPNEWIVYAISYKTKESDSSPRCYQFHLKLAQRKNKCQLSFADNTGKDVIERLLASLTLGRVDCIGDIDTLYMTSAAYFTWRHQDVEVHIVNNEHLRQALTDYLNCFN